MAKEISGTATVQETVPVRVIEAMPIDETALTPELVEKIVKQAQLRQDTFNKLLVVALNGTNPDGWMDFGGNPWPATAEAERLRRDFGISITDLQERLDEGVDDRGPWYTYTVRGTVSSPLFGSMEVTGRAGSRDQFFAKVGGELKPASEVDRPSVAQAAYSNMLQNGVTRLLGLRGYSWEQLTVFSGGRVNKDRATRVKFKSRESQGGDATKDSVPVSANRLSWVVKLEALS